MPAKRTEPLICGHPDREHEGLGMCHACYQKATYNKAQQKVASKKYRDKKSPAYQEYLKRQSAKRMHEWYNDPVQRRKFISTIYKRKFGISVDDYESMLENQRGLCAACGRPETSMRNGKVKRLAVDHNHTTGEVRGLLCCKCNTVIGFTEENISILQGIENYLVSSDAYRTTIGN